MGYVPRRAKVSGSRGPNWFLWLFLTIGVLILSLMLGDLIGYHFVGSRPSSSTATQSPTPPVIPQAPGDQGSPVSPLPGGTNQEPLPSPQAQPSVPSPLLLPPPASEGSSEAATEQPSPTPEPDGLPAGETSPPPSVPPVGGGGAHGEEKGGKRYVIQAGLFVKADHAEELRNRLVKNGYKAEIEEIPRDGGVYFRVKVGDYTTKAQAQASAHKLAKTGHHVFVLSKEPSP